MNAPAVSTVFVASPTKRFLSAEGMRALFAQLCRLRAGGAWYLGVRSRQIGYTRWARNEVIGAGETLTHELFIGRRVRGSWGIALTDRLDLAALEDAVTRAEQSLHLNPPSVETDTLDGLQEYLRPTLWSDATFAVDSSVRAEAQAQLVAPVMAAGLLSSGFLQVTALGHGVMNSGGLFAYAPETQAECSVTVRNAKGTASGWAGKSHREFAALDTARLVARAIDKCQRSKDAVAVEPGRYTVILEPQAAGEFLAPFARGLDRRDIIEYYKSRPWFWKSDSVYKHGFASVDSLGYEIGPYGMTYIGQPNLLVDSRVSISVDPEDPEMPFVPFTASGVPSEAATWIEQGRLKSLGYSRFRPYLRRMRRTHGLNNVGAYRMASGPTSVAEMIANTERGLLVTRFVGIRPVAEALEVGLQTGNTSDGLWLIEKGQLKEPVQNFRFRESPYFALNNLEALGLAERIYHDPPVIAPALKIKDFSMVSLANAV